MAETPDQHIDDVKHPPPLESTGSNQQTQAAGRPSMESYLKTDKPSVLDDSLAQHYRERCSRLEGELHDADRKIRQQVDEIMQLKRELSKDRTETLLSHQKELSELKEAHRNETERLKESHRRDTRDFERQITDIERRAFKMELEHRSGDRTTGHRILDMLEDVAPTLFENVTEILGGALSGQIQPGLPAGEHATTEFTPDQADQLRQAFKEDMAGNATHTENKSSPDTPINQTMKTPQSGEGDESPHRSPFGKGETPVGLNDFFANKTNGHPEPDMEGS